MTDKFGGGGGGKQQFAQAGGLDPSMFDEMIRFINNVLINQ